MGPESNYGYGDAFIELLGLVFLVGALCLLYRTTGPIELPKEKHDRKSNSYYSTSKYAGSLNDSGLQARRP
jgi:hypothetical protein